jgi:hypothetical protein
MTLKAFRYKASTQAGGLWENLSLPTARYTAINKDVVHLRAAGIPRLDLCKTLFVPGSWLLSYPQTGSQ